MKSILKISSIVALATVLSIGCNSGNKENTTENNTKEFVTSSNPNKGKQVPNNLVCMVNDEYMGKQQLEVPFEGKMYYGCCKMCQERIPKEESVRYAIDPHSLKKISKADAYIVVIGNNDEVAYFENEENYKQFLAVQNN